jgi:hypothetical protein
VYPTLTKTFISRKRATRKTKQQLGTLSRSLPRKAGQFTANVYFSVLFKLPKETKSKEISRRKMKRMVAIFTTTLKSVISVKFVTVSNEQYRKEFKLCLTFL